MHPLLFIAILAAVSMAMVFAMVQFARARLQARDDNGWRTAYVLSWAAIIAVVVVFLRDEPGAIRRNLPILILFPAAWFALHALIVRFAIAVREAPRPPPRPPIEQEEVEEQEIAHEPLPPPPTLLQRTITLVRSAARMAVPVAIAIVLIALGQNIELLHRIDAELAPYRGQLVKILIAAMVIGFAIYMGGIIRFVLGGGQSAEIALREIWTNKLFAFIASGVVLLLAAGAALGIVFAPPGIKLLVMLAVGYIALRIALLP